MVPLGVGASESRCGSGVFAHTVLTAGHHHGVDHNHDTGPSAGRGPDRGRPRRVALHRRVRVVGVTVTPHLGHPQLPQHAGPFRNPPTTTKETTPTSSNEPGCKAPTGTVVAHLPEPRPETVNQEPEPKCQA